MNCVLEPRYDGTDYVTAHIWLPSHVLEDTGVAYEAGTSALREDRDADLEAHAVLATV